MRHQRLRRKLGVKSQHRKALLKNLVRALVTHKRIKTTHAKAKEASAFTDKMITLAKRGDLHARRLLIAKLGCIQTVSTLIRQIAPQFKDRKGGYTRVLRLGKWRNGDASEMALLEFSTMFEVPEKARKPKKPKKEKDVKVEEKPSEKPKKEKEKDKPKEKTKEAEKETPAKDVETGEKPKEEEGKKGGFLGALRKFLKGSE